MKRVFCILDSALIGFYLAAAQAENMRLRGKVAVVRKSREEKGWGRLLLSIMGRDIKTTCEIELVRLLDVFRDQESPHHHLKLYAASGFKMNPLQ